MPNVRKPHDIARDREVFQHLKLMEGDSNSEVARKTGVSAACIARLRIPAGNGGTRFPHNVTLDAIARGYGMRRVLVPVADKPLRRPMTDREIRLH